MGRQETGGGATSVAVAAAAEPDTSQAMAPVGTDVLGGAAMSAAGVLGSAAMSAGVLGSAAMGAGVLGSAAIVAGVFGGGDQFVQPAGRSFALIRRFSKPGS